MDVTGARLVGLSLSADDALVENIYAVLIARSLGNRSVDYTRKAYGRYVPELIDRDRAVKRLYQTHMAAYDRFYHGFLPPRSDEPLGVFAFDLTMVRARTSIELLLYAARRGYIIEVSLIARGLLEQFAYAHVVWRKDNDGDVFGLRVSKLVPRLKPVRPAVGRMYGWLSKLAHYDTSEHYQFIGDAEASTVTQRSWAFKISALAILFAILDLKFAIFRAAYREADHFDDAFQSVLDLPLVEEFESFFEDVDVPAVQFVRTCLTVGS
ncbi:MAG: hypothetical protein ACJ8EB_06015 [Allosphingosinicella sp.]